MTDYSVRVALGLALGSFRWCPLEGVRTGIELVNLCFLKIRSSNLFRYRSYVVMEPVKQRFNAPLQPKINADLGAKKY
jgi:hypothetical protein